MRQLVSPEINKPDSPAPLIVTSDPDRDLESVIFGGWDPLVKRHNGGAIDHAGLTRKDCNFTSRVLRQSWGRDFHTHSWDDIRDGKHQLLQTIKELKPSIIVACGNEAAYDLVPNWRTLTDRTPDKINSGGKSIKSAKGMMDRRGFLWYPDEHDLPVDCPVLVTLHPAACRYQAMPHRLMLDIDFQRMGAVIRGELPRVEWPTFKRIRNKADLAPLWDAELTAYDIEVKWGGTAFLCIAFYTNTGQAFLAYNDGLRACEDYLRSSCPKLTHNGQFDRYYLEKILGIPVGGRHEDSIVGHWACYPELAGKEETGREDQKKKNKNVMTRKGLNFLGSFHLNVGWWKTYTSDPVRMGSLCVNDVAATMWAWQVIEPDIDDMGVRLQYEKQLRKIPALMKIQQRGMTIDEAFRLQRVALLEEREVTLTTTAREAAEAYIKHEGLTHREDGAEYWWYHSAACKCCGGGSIKAQHCPTCAKLKGTGANGAIKKADLALWLWRKTKNKPAVDALSKAEMAEFIPPCEVCGGTGKRDIWSFNIMSSTQLTSLLWDILDIPKYLTGGDDPNASEETIRNVLEWAEE